MAENPANTDSTTTLLVEKHKAFIKALDTKKEDFEYWVTEHLRMSGIYWAITAMDIMNSLDEMDKEEIIKFALSCLHPCGGFGGNVNHDPHLLYTCSAVQILCELDAVDRLNKDLVVKYIVGLQQPDGSFVGDSWGEIDTRFSYCAMLSLALLKSLDAIDLDKAVAFILSCKNFDGSFGCIPGAESHSGQTFCCLGALAIAQSWKSGGKWAWNGELQGVDRNTLGWWLCERQLPGGGLNGRPEKLPDVCYSWWVLSSLSILNCVGWINTQNLTKFILQCQDSESGGIADRPGDLVDVFHTFFGVAGLSLLSYPDLEPIDPVYALTRRTLRKLNIPLPWVTSEQK